MRYRMRYCNAISHAIKRYRICQESRCTCPNTERWYWYVFNTYQHVLVCILACTEHVLEGVLACSILYWHVVLIPLLNVLVSIEPVPGHVFVRVLVGFRTSNARYWQNTCQNTYQYVLVCIEYIPIPPLRIGHVFRYVFACINYWYVPIHTKYASNTCKIRINTDWYVSIPVSYTHLTLPTILRV